MRTTWIGAAAALLLSATVGHARVGNPCINDATQTKKECKADCVEAKQQASDGCINKDHLCVEACRDGRQACIDGTGLQAALDQCNATLKADIATCRQNNPPGTLRDQCVDQHQITAFICRQNARKVAKPLLKACRTGFRTCVKTCPPGNGTPADDPRACRDSAKAAFVDCIQGCNEDFQVQVDACRNRDHNCVEQCRADRAACLDPVVALLEAKIAFCNQTRDNVLANQCGPMPDGPAKDQCILDARVNAFVCRDDAHEQSHDGIKACRDGFKSCAQACPPAS